MLKLRSRYDDDKFMKETMLKLPGHYEDGNYRVIDRVARCNVMVI